jgi:hypothetical protein
MEVLERTQHQDQVIQALSVSMPIPGPSWYESSKKDPIPGPGWDQPCPYSHQYQDQAGMKVLKRTRYQDQAGLKLLKSTKYKDQAGTFKSWYETNMVCSKVDYHTNTGHIQPASENSLENTIRSSTVNLKLVFNSSWYLMPNLMSLPTEPINIQPTDLTVHSQPTSLILPTS